jgi:hypothetical protein
MSDMNAGSDDRREEDPDTTDGTQFIAIRVFLSSDPAY